MTSPSSSSSCSGLRTSTTSAPSRRSTAACSRKLPWTASTPTLMSRILRREAPLPAARLEQLARIERRRRDPGHRLAEAGRDASEHVCVLEVRCRLDDRLPATVRVAGLEDPRPDEDAVRAELHAERRVGRRRDAACGERDDGEAAVLGHPANELVRGLEVLRLRVELLLARRAEPPDRPEDGVHVGHGVDDVAGPRL